ncbi:SDR family oxidoreductase [Maribacter sp. ACAM166]|uniref:SDR family oxidoreductase n=1 Tax=Maribacter sp. ACAM166 TaxID=2508996 RepID=UPI0010FD8D8A|nr:SDR family oxidoreductase [Maribacter sp. ACAM166]TLP79113.1 SDR family oxidoreductase [Maribacter sp. ACAM166]
MDNFKNKIALITGGASGIGEIMARLLMERDATVIIWDINEENSEKVRLKYSSLGKLTVMKVDVSNSSEIKNAASQVLSDFGGIDVLINNAGIIVGTYFHEHSKVDIANTMNINVNAPILITHAFIDTMLSKNSGHICNISSSGGLLSNPKMSVYVASKWSLIGFSDSLRLEMEQLNKNIKVTTIMPYYINTGMFEGVKSKIPILDPEATALTIIKSIAKEKKMVSIPGYIYRVTRFAQAILPVSIFDWFTGNVLGIYKTMDHFKGRKN